MNTLIVAYPELAPKKLLYDGLSKQLYNGVPSTIDVIQRDYTFTYNFSQMYIDGIYGFAIDLEFMDFTHFISNISVNAFDNSNNEIFCINDIFFYIRTLRININELGENTTLPFLWLKNNINKIYVLINQDMATLGGLAKIRISFRAGHVSKNKLYLFNTNLPADLVKEELNRECAITN